MSDSEANELRLIANEIIRKLYMAGQRGQIEILHIYSEVALTRIDEAKDNPK